MPADAPPTVAPPPGPRFVPQPRHLVLVFLVLVLAALLVWRRPPAEAPPRECTADDLTAAYAALARSEQALAAPPKQGAWPATAEAFRDYRHCDEGPIRIGFTGVACQLLARRWSEVSDVAREARRQRWLMPFLVSHLADGCKAEDRTAIARQAARKCPRYAKTFCAELRRAAEQRAVAEQDLP